MKYVAVSVTFNGGHEEESYERLTAETDTLAKRLAQLTSPFRFMEHCIELYKEDGKDYRLFAKRKSDGRWCKKRW